MVTDYFDTLKDKNFEQDMYQYAKYAEKLYSYGFFLPVSNVARFYFEETLKNICHNINKPIVRDEYGDLSIAKTINNPIHKYLNGDKRQLKIFRVCQSFFSDKSHNNVDMEYDESTIKGDAQEALKAMYNLHKWYCNIFFEIELYDNYNYPEIIDIEDIKARKEESDRAYDAIEKELNELKKKMYSSNENCDKSASTQTILDLQRQLDEASMQLQKYEQIIADYKEKILKNENSKGKNNKNSQYEVAKTIIKMQKEIIDLKERPEYKKRFDIIEKLKQEIKKLKEDNANLKNYGYSKNSSGNQKKSIFVRKTDEKRFLSEIENLKNDLNYMENRNAELYKQTCNLKNSLTEVVNAKSILEQKLYEVKNRNISTYTDDKLKQENETLKNEIIKIKKFYTAREYELREKFYDANLKVPELNESEKASKPLLVTKKDDEKLLLAYSDASKDKDIDMQLYSDILLAIREMSKVKAYITRNTIRTFLVGNENAENVRYKELYKLKGFGNYRNQIVEQIQIENILFYLEDGEIIQNNSGFYRLLVK